MKKVSTAAAKQSRNISQPKLTIGLDLGDRTSWYCVLDEAGQSTAGAAGEHDCESSARGVRQQCRAAASRWRPGRIRRG